MGESLHSLCAFLQGENDNLREQVTRLEGERDALKAERDEARTLYAEAGFALGTLKRREQGLVAELDRARDDNAVFYENMKAAEKRASEYKAALELVGEELQDCQHKEGKFSPAPTSPEAVCVWTPIQWSGDKVLRYKTNCGHDGDFDTIPTICSCKRPIQLKEVK